MFTLLTLAGAEANLREIVERASSQGHSSTHSAILLLPLSLPLSLSYSSHLRTLHKSMRPLYKRIIESVATRAKTLIDPAQQVTKKPVDVVAMASTTVTPSSNWAKLQQVRVRAKFLYLYD